MIMYDELFQDSMLMDELKIRNKEKKKYDFIVLLIPPTLSIHH